MGDKRNYAALDWVIGEIGETLKEARQSLEAYVEDPRDTARIRFCLTHIHQVHGSLQMVEFHGASLFAEEMELLAEAIMNGQVTNDKEAHEGLMRSLLQLPLYLDQVRTHHQDHPGVVLPLLNDLRAVRKQSYLSETNLFNPDLSSINRIQGDRHAILRDIPKLREVLKKLREMYQFAAASVLRGVKIDENLAYIDKVFTRLEHITRGTACHPIWEVSVALIDALAHDNVELSIAVRGLLRHLAREIKVLEDHCPAAFDAPPRDPLLRNVLYYVARAVNGGPRIEEIKHKFGLENALFGGGEKFGAGENGTRAPMTQGLISPPEPDAVKAVVLALQDELNTCKHLLDLALSGQGGMSDLDEMRPLVKRIGDTLAVLGIGDLREQAARQHQALVAICSAGSFADGALIDIGAGLANIENRLEAIAKGISKHKDYTQLDEHEVEIDAAKEAVLTECRVGLDHVKNAILESMTERWDPAHLPAAADTLHYVQGGLHMVPLVRPAAVIAACGEFISRYLLVISTTPNHEMQVFADAIASIDYFLERLLGGHGEDLDNYLKMAEACASELRGFIATVQTQDAPTQVDQDASPQSEFIAEESHLGEEVVPTQDSVDDAGSSETVDETVDEGASFEVAADAANESHEIVESPQSFGDAESAPLEPTIDLPEASSDAAESLSESELAEVEPEPLASATDMESTSESGDGNELGEYEIPMATAVVESASVEESEDDESDIDAEIIEIFVEESHEVLATLAEYLPKWGNDLSDESSLVIVRRAFHTLKGSGRMVQAYDVGELGWAIESMLNRVIDRSIVAQDIHIGLIHRVIEFVPRLVDAFASRQPNPNPEDHAQFIAWAQQLASGNIPSELSGERPSELSGEHAPAIEEVSAPVEEVVDVDESEDQALWDIFASEASAHLQVLDQYTAEMDQAAPLYTGLTDAVQRSLHTLKGSAHMATITPIATMIAPLESFVKEMRSYQLRIDDDILQLIKDASVYTRQGLDCIDRRELVVLPKLEQFIARVGELHGRYVAPLIHMREMGVAQHQGVDPSLLEEFMSQDMKLLLDADRYVRHWQSEGNIPVQDLWVLLAELRQLEDVAARANLPDLKALANSLAKVYEALGTEVIALSPTLFEAISAGHETLLDMLDQVAAAMTVQTPSAELFAALANLIPAGELESEPELVVDSEPVVELELVEVNSADPEFSPLEDFSVESAESIDLDVPAPDQDELAYEPQLELDEEYEDAEDSVDEPRSSLIEEPVLSEAYVAQAGFVESAYSPISFGGDVESTEDELILSNEYALEVGDDDVPTLYEEVSSDDLSQEAEISQESELGEDPEIVELSREDLLETETAGEGDLFVSANHHEYELSPASSAHQQHHYEPVTAPHVETPRDIRVQETQDEHTAYSQSVGSDDVGFIETDEFDPDILEIFLEEAGELIEELDEAIHAWESNWSDEIAPETMKRALHTLKGGARLSGLKNLGELTHNYESYLISTGEPSADQQFFQVLHAYQDNILNGVRGVRARLNGEAVPAVAVVATLPVVPAEREIISSAHDEPMQLPAEIESPVFTEEPVETDDDGGFVEPRSQPRSAVTNANKRQGSQEMIKVSADLLEELVNLAGETSISRGRLEQQISDLGSAVDEVDGTLRRLNEQLRRLDIETDAQVVFRQEQMAAYEGFDPLEMDRYSQLQQLTRSLMESASDLGDLRHTLTDKIKDTETLLLQQSRINTALQHGLMRSRMVPFSRLVPRLRRIVRQVSGELGKHVNFELDNVEGEMDRSVLERMVAPLEHMLRNAVDHGIEMPDDRLKAQKPETGRILLSLAREGGDILLRLADDGRGINLERVRAKAVERGLMAADADLSEHDIMQFILQAGFSTAENVTHISGRGVGMDVVAAEIKQLGGSIMIESKTGAGSQFTVRLPFTVSVNRALMVVIGVDTYAIPLNTIEGIVRVSPFELEHYYSHPDARFEYAGENYRVRHLGALLNPDSRPNLDGQALPLPVILVRSAQHTMALQVDGLLGSREIVVKSLGRQFAAVQGLSGATVMGDGSVVVIIDPHALVRRDVAQSASPTFVRSLPAPVELVPALKTIMVVDDSVTVRKVTSRFLEREGYNVITANDGVDALQILQEQVPDLMLLDIEMPRMDGFEVAKNIRSTRRLKHLPIIMITSRTGDKHRQHALSIGVNDYLGKPYQEEALLKTMQALLAAKNANA